MTPQALINKAFTMSRNLCCAAAAGNVATGAYICLQLAAHTCSSANSTGSCSICVGGCYSPPQDTHPTWVLLIVSVGLRVQMIFVLVTHGLESWHHRLRFVSRHVVYLSRCQPRLLLDVSSHELHTANLRTRLRTSCGPSRRPTKQRARNMLPHGIPVSTVVPHRMPPSTAIIPYISLSPAPSLSLCLCL